MSEVMVYFVCDLKLFYVITEQLESATERYKIVQSNAAGYKKEIDLLQERNHKSAASILKHESAIAHLKEVMCHFHTIVVLYLFD